MENRSLRMCARPWLQPFPCGVSMSSSCWKWHQDMVYYLQRERLICLVVFWSNRSPEFLLHWSLCSSIHTINSLQWVHIAVCREHNIHVALSRKYRYHLWTQQDEFQVWQGHRLYIHCIILGKDETSRNPCGQVHY